jgi:inhibitor of cysteine peptidase
MQKRLLLVSVAVLLSALTASVFAQTEEMTVDAQQEFDISLPSNPSTGYQWMVNEISDESVVKYVKSTFVPSGEQMPGSGGTEALTFRAEREGTATITLQYVRSWETDQPAETRTISVNVVDNSAGTVAGPIYLVAESAPEGKYNVTVLWFSDDIGQENNFSIKVFDTETNQEVYEDLTLDFSILQGDQVLVSKHLTGPAFPSTEGNRFTYGDKYAFDSEGIYSLRIGNINGSNESVEFPMQVTPEFASIALLVAVPALAGIVAARALAKRRFI